MLELEFLQEKQDKRIIDKDKMETIQEQDSEVNFQVSWKEL